MIQENITSLSGFCSEMRRLAATIPVPEEILPYCGREGRQGWSVDISPVGEFVLSASERGEPYEIFRSTDPQATMEATFADITERLANAEVASSLPPLTWWNGWAVRWWGPHPLKRLRQVQRRQEELLSLVNEVWRDRAATRNALKLRTDVDFWVGLT